MSEFKGYSLFNDIEDAALRDRNRAVVMANIVEDHVQPDSTISPRATLLILGYFNRVPEEQRREVMDLFRAEVRRRGFATKAGFQ